MMRAYVRVRRQADFPLLLLLLLLLMDRIFDCFVEFFYQLLGCPLLFAVRQCLKVYLQLCLK